MIVWLAREARIRIEHEATSMRPLESGGALFGWQTEDSCVIACAGDPGPRAQHHRHSFQADRAHTQELIDDVHSRSNGRCRFLGSWHSHPDGSQVPSSRDARTAQAIALDPDVGVPEPLVLVVRLNALQETEPDPILGCYRWISASGSLAETLLVDADVGDNWC